MFNQISRQVAAFFFILSLGMGYVPALAYAHGNDDNDNEDPHPAAHVEKEDRHDSDDDKGKGNDPERKAQKEENKSCRKAFKHLFNKGNLGNKAADFYIECLRPFGFEATYNGTSTSTPDTTAPIISSLSVNPATTTAVVTWHTDENADSAAFWSTSSGVDTGSASNKTNNSLVKNHELTITGLSASTTYYLIVRARDGSSNTATSSEVSFTTDGAAPADHTPPVISNVSKQVGTSTAEVTWDTDELATSRVYYSTSSDMDINATSTSFIENLTLTLHHIISFVGLLPQTVYYLVIRSVDGSGNTATSTLMTATTTSI